MLYKYIGYKPRDDWIVCNCVIRMDEDGKIPPRIYELGT